MIPTPSPDKKRARVGLYLAMYAILLLFVVIGFTNLTGLHSDCTTTTTVNRSEYHTNYQTHYQCR